MEREPRDPGRPILTRGLIAWLVTTGLIMGVGTFSLYALFFPIATRGPRMITKRTQTMGAT
jgi:hypothetical protein